MKDDTSSEKPVQANEIVNENPDPVVHLRRLTVSALYIPYQGRFMWGKGKIHPFFASKGSMARKGRIYDPQSGRGDRERQPADHKIRRNVR